MPGSSDRFDLEDSAKTVVALLATPLVTFGSTSVTLFVGNQEELSYQLGTVTVFAVEAMICFLCGVLFFALARWKGWRRALWAYLLFGPSFVVMAMLRDMGANFLDHWLATLVFALAYLGGVWVASARLSLRTAIEFSFVMALLLFAVDGARLAHASLSRDPVSREVEVDLPVNPASERSEPNVYHLIFDGFQSDLFDSLLDDGVRQGLGGFRFYPEANANYSRTRWSVPSTMLGSLYDFSTSHVGFQRQAFNSERSLLHAMQQAGYSTNAYTRKLYSFDLALFDQVTQHSDNIDLSKIANRRSFVSLWIYRYVPRDLTIFMAERDWLIDRSDLLGLEDQTFLADSAPIESYLSFQNFLLDEPGLAGSGRYTFIHLLIPHSPYVFNSECEEVRSADMREQSQCAIRMILQLVHRLQETGRFDDSLILIHGDHGMGYKWVDGEFQKQEYRSHRTLLLVKPSGVAADGELRISERPVSLLAVAPTLSGFVGGERGDFVAKSLLDEGASEVDPVQHSYFVIAGDSMQRHTVAGRELEPGETVRFRTAAVATAEELDPIPIVPIGRVIEAESGRMSGAVDRIETLPGTSGSCLRNGTVSFRFELREASSVRLRARLITPSSNNDSASIRINDGNPSDWHMGKSRTWRWVDNPEVWELEAGTHALYIDYREPVYLDQIEILAGRAEG